MFAVGMETWQMRVLKWQVLYGGLYLLFFFFFCFGFSLNEETCIHPCQIGFDKLVAALLHVLLVIVMLYMGEILGRLG